MAAKKVKAAVLTMAAVAMMAGSVDARGRGGRDIEFTDLDRGPTGPWRTEMAVMCLSQQEWEADMATMAAEGKMVGTVPAPQIDWNRQSVVLVTMGQRYSSGYDVRVTRVTRRGQDVVVEVQTTSPSGGFKTPTMTAPFHMIVVDAPGARNLRVMPAVAAAGPSASDFGAEAETVSWGSLKESYLPR